MWTNKDLEEKQKGKKGGSNYEREVTTLVKGGNMER